MPRNAHGQAIAWGAAGIPLVIALVQTILALFGYTSSSAGLTPIAEPVLSIAVLYEAAVVFKDSSVVVMGLFLLIVLAWAGQGVAMLVVEHREAAYGAATLSAVLFFALFFGVYFPLTSADVPAVQLGAFYLVPIVAAALQFFAVYAYPWNDVVLEETSGDLGRLESELSSVRTSFESAYDARFERLDALEAVAPGGVRDVRDGAASYRDRLDDLQAEIDEIRTLSDGEAATNARAKVESELESMAPQRRVDDLANGFEQALASGIRTEYGDFVVRSEYGERYDVVNLPTTYRECTLPGNDDAIHLKHVDEELLALTRQADSFGAVADAVQAVDDHRERVRSHLREREAPIVDAADRVRDSLDTLHGQIDSMDVPFEDRLREVLIDGRDPDLVGARDVRADVDRAKEALHDCRFDDAESIAEAAADDAQRLVTTAELLSTLEVSIDNRHRSVSVPADVPLGYVNALLPALRGGYAGVDPTLDEAARTIRFAFDDVSPDQTTDTTETATSAGSTATPNNGSAESASSAGTASSRDSVRVAPPEEVVDGVLFALREFEDGAADDRIAQFKLESLPDAVATQDVLVNVERFASRQSDLFDTVDLQSPEPPGFIEFTAADDASVERAMSTAHQRFREKYT